MSHQSALSAAAWISEKLEKRLDRVPRHTEQSASGVNVQAPPVKPS